MQSGTGMSSRRQQRGVSAVEFAIALPVLLFMFLGVVEFGRAFLQFNALNRAVRDSARLVAEEALRGQAGTVNLDAALIARARNLVVFGNGGGTGQVLLPGLAPGNVTVQNLGNGNISVLATYAYQPIIAGGIPDVVRGGAIGTLFTLRAEVVMRAIS